MSDGLKAKHRAAIITTLAANDRVERAVLFGSRAMGTNTITSDVDIALFGQQLTLTDQASLAAACEELPMAQSVDLVLHSAIDNPALVEHIRSYGVEWYQRGGGDADGRLDEPHRAILAALLQEHLPNVEAWIQVKPIKASSSFNTRLDVVLRGSNLQVLPHEQMESLAQVILASALAVPVRIKDWAQLPDVDREEIMREGVSLNSNKFSVADRKQYPLFHKWTKMNLGKVCTKIGSGATPRGGKGVYERSGPYALIRSQNVHNDGLSINGIAYIGHQHAAELKNVEVVEGDVLLNITGDSVARVCQVQSDVLPARVNQHVAIIRPDYTKLTPRFLRYILLSPGMQAKLHSLASSGGTRNALTKATIQSLDIIAPQDICQQRSIAHVLGTLDDKIQLNRRMNETLEAMARALFKDWFVDFGPVRAKAEGREAYLPEEIWGLFPDSFEDSELGEIPRGWRVKPLSEIATFLNGLALQKYPATSPEDSLPVIKIAELRNGISAKTDKASRNIPKKYIVTDGDFLFSWSGSLMAEFWTEGEGALNQHLFKVTSDQYPPWFFAGWVRFHLDGFQRIAASKATTMGHIQRSHLQAALASCPPDDVLTVLDQTIRPLVKRSIQNDLETRTLAQIRDLLLPKLMSREIRVAKTEKVVEVELEARLDKLLRQEGSKAEPILKQIEPSVEDINRPEQQTFVDRNHSATKNLVKPGGDHDD